LSGRRAARDRGQLHGERREEKEEEGVTRAPEKRASPRFSVRENREEDVVERRRRAKDNDE
jgi:hypothetical protein